MSRRLARTGILLSIPTAVLVLVLFVAPLVLAVWMSLNDWPLIGTPKFNAPDNYVALAQDSRLWDTVWFTVRYALVTTVIYAVVGLALALLVQAPSRGVGAYRTLFLLPSAIGLSSASLLFYALYNNDFGPLDDVFRFFGLSDGYVDFLGTPGSAFASTLVLVTWRFVGFNMLILLTGLQAISLDVYEAARTDGANAWQTLWHITLPLLRPTILIVLVTSITGGFLAFEPFYVMTQGGPDSSTFTVVMYMVNQAFAKFDVGGAAALAVAVLVVLVVINVVQLRLFRSKES